MTKCINRGCTWLPKTSCLKFYTICALKFPTHRETFTGNSPEYNRCYILTMSDSIFRLSTMLHCNLFAFYEDGFLERQRVNSNARYPCKIQIEQGALCSKMLIFNHPIFLKCSITWWKCRETWRLDITKDVGWITVQHIPHTTNEVLFYFLPEVSISLRGIVVACVRLCMCASTLSLSAR